ncbi:hypothetical protein [Burkholderia multivorans]|uniref:hypothetical protein n=1 Tax=Burkholderia multivorans TaxID=87883 RepID=UPI001589082A|nr:hypothetical protein [Burkholderia multivorans]
MFKRIAEGWKARQIAKAIDGHPVLGKVLSHLRDVLNDTSQGLGKHFSEAGKEHLVTECLADIDRQLSQPNPALAVRMRLLEFMILSAQFDVLVMQPPTPFEGLSGELRPHIPTLKESDKDLREFFYGLDSPVTSPDDMWDAVLFRYWVMNLYVNAYNIARIVLQDFHTDKTKDWLRPCYISLCIWQENSYRQCLGLPAVIPGDDPAIRAIGHSVWMNLAQQGHQHLRLEWENAWEDMFKEPSPYAGLAP